MVKKKRQIREDLDTLGNLDIERISKSAKGKTLNESFGHDLSSLATEKYPEILSTYGEMTREQLLRVISILKAHFEIQAGIFIETDEALGQLWRAVPAIRRLNTYAQASVKGKKSHKVDRDSKKEAFAWCDEHHHLYPRNMDGMATALAEQMAPYKWRTVRDWITDWAKERKLRSAGRQDSN